MQVLGVTKLEVVDEEELARLDELYGYGDVLAIGALVSSCRRFRELLERGCHIEILGETTIALTDQQDLKHWLGERFDTAVVKDVFKIKPADEPGVSSEPEGRQKSRGPQFGKTLLLSLVAVGLLAVLRRSSEAW